MLVVVPDLWEVFRTTDIVDCNRCWFQGYFTQIAKWGWVMVAKVDAGFGELVTTMAGLESRAEELRVQARRLLAQAAALEAEAAMVRDEAEERARAILGARKTMVMVLPSGVHVEAKRSRNPAVEILGKVPDEFSRVRVCREPDKVRIRAAIEGGEVLDFARLRERRVYLKVID